MNGDGSILTASLSRSSVPGKGVVEGATKNGQARMIYLSKDMTDILRSYCYQKMREAQKGGFEMSDHVFTNELGELMHPDIFSRYLRRLYDKNNFPREFHLHTLRHYFDPRCSTTVWTSRLWQSWPLTGTPASWSGPTAIRSCN